MVEKMPAVANKALDQFHVTNRGSRQQFFFLNYLEPDPDIDEVSFLNMSVLGAVSAILWLFFVNVFSYIQLICDTYLNGVESFVQL